MKRTQSLSRSGSRPTMLEKALTEEQFAGIGAVIMHYTEVEGIVQMILADQLGLEGNFRKGLISRINGFEGICALIMEHAGQTIPNTAEIPQEGTGGRFVDSCKPELILTLKAGIDAAFELKSYRDAISHAVMFNAENGIAVGGGGKQKKYEVLLTPSGLSALRERAIALKHELSAIKQALLLSYSAKHLFLPREDGERFEARFEPEVQEALAYAVELQGRRRSLDPLPTFPKQ